MAEIPATANENEDERKPAALSSSQTERDRQLRYSFETPFLLSQSKRQLLKVIDDGGFTENELRAYHQAQR